MQRPFTRRTWLRAAGGVSLALPLLDRDTKPAAAATKAAEFSVFVVGCNGVVQGSDNEPDRFWPSAVGPLTAASLERDKTSRATGLLAAHAQRLTLVRGVHAAHADSKGCSHTWGDNQALTAALGSGEAEGAATSLALGESIDHRIAREKQAPGQGPLTLHAGFNNGGGKGYGNPGYVSYKAAKQPNAIDSSPWAAYSRLAGLDKADPEMARKVAAQRTTVNDLVRKQLQMLLADSKLSAEDKRRLDQHLTGVRDLEVKVTGTLPADRIELMKQLDVSQGGQQLYQSDAKRPEVIRLHMDVLTLAVASGAFKAATLKVGDNNDGAGYVVDGNKLGNFHTISHRTDESGMFSTAQLIEQHAKIDRMMMNHLAYFLDSLAARNTPLGNLADSGLVMWTNQVANGGHGWNHMPYVLAGRAGGALAAGQFVDAGGVKHNKLLNSVLSAAGVRKSNGALVDDFGTPGLPGGVLPAILAVS